MKLLATLLLLLPLAVQAQAPQVIPVANLAAAPKVDGELGEWGSSGWVKVPVKPALEREDRAKYGLDPAGERNKAGSLAVELKAGVAAGRLYLAVRYPDDAADTVHKEWSWRGDKYQRENQLEDMFAVRFHLAGDFDRTMLSTKDYKVDVWLWSAARTNPGGIAEDMTHHVTTKMQESAAEYQVKDGPVIYISKRRDEGTAPYEMLPRPKENKGERLPSFAAANASGSAADVAAKGVWKAGYWNLEFARALDTGNADDVVFKPGSRLTGQVAVFNKANAEHKSVSEPLVFDFGAVK
ncbi:ethylbenzene dehydrogenase-related protein [Aromatoleum toluclasticum]|uniref:ethylbenzene dehydrogenase-related protein n=1 Tax=Aromatoleum toluclasticum TaxID=92003 RepID=UPI001D17FCB0|nr:ethylbenzene dehydrogenase-related protein [Aromatoleum toluclasticum]MCC4117447.1 ethylbenzene dehydrogenase-related protein [Aromatoleum toluclasticum]